MPSRKLRHLPILACLVALCAAPEPAAAATINLRAQLTGHQEVPPNASPGFGTASLQFDDVTRQLTVNLTVGRLSGPLSAAHVHGPALPGVNAPIIFNLAPPGTVTIVTLTPAQAAELLAGLWYVNAQTSQFPDGEARGQIGQALPFSAVLPNSRSVPVGAVATAFASIVNAGVAAGVGCGIALASPIPATFTYQTTDPATNLVTGSPNTPVSIPAGRIQSFVIALVPTAPFPPTEVRFAFDCDNSPPAPVTVGLDTLLLSATATPGPDIVAITLAPAPFDGFLAPGSLLLSGPSVPGAFVVAAANVGAAGALTVTADTGDFPFSLTVTLCQTNIATAACQTPPASSVGATLGAGDVAGFAVFVTSPGNVPFLPAVRRLFIRFRNAAGAIVGSTSIAVTTGFVPF